MTLLVLEEAKRRHRTETVRDRGGIKHARQAAESQATKNERHTATHNNKQQQADGPME